MNNFNYEPGDLMIIVRTEHTYSGKYCKIVTMIRVLQKAGSFFSVVLLAVLTLGLYAGALTPETTHDMEGVSHNASSASSCITVCSSATFHKDDYLNDVEENNDDKPGTPYYVQFLSSTVSALKKEHNQEIILALEREPPPGGLPAYIALTVFRA